MSIPLTIRPRTRKEYKRVFYQLLDTDGARKYLDEGVRDYFYYDPPFELQVKKKRGLKTITLLELENLENKTLKIVSYLAYVMEVLVREGTPYEPALYSYMQKWDFDDEEYAVAVGVGYTANLTIMSLGMDGTSCHVYFHYRGAPTPSTSDPEKVITDTYNLIPL